MVVAPWWIRNIAREHNPVFPQSLPLVGHGINVGAHGGVDADFVPRKVAWPVYPLIEAIDDRSGLGPLFAGALLPGLAIALWKGRRRPVLLLLGAFVGTLPFWWRYTLHEPRFFLPHFGLALVCVPWALLAVSRRWFATIRPGDNAAIAAVLAREHPIYASQPRTTLAELAQMVTRRPPEHR